MVLFFYHGLGVDYENVTMETLSVQATVRVGAETFVATTEVFVNIQDVVEGINLVSTLPNRSGTLFLESQFSVVDYFEDIDMHSVLDYSYTAIQNGQTILLDWLTLSDEGLFEIKENSELGEYLITVQRTKYDVDGEQISVSAGFVLNIWTPTVSVEARSELFGSVSEDVFDEQVVTGLIVGSDTANATLLNNIDVVYYIKSESSYGDVRINYETGQWHYALDSDISEVNDLGEGDILLDHFVVEVVSGINGTRIYQTIDITINGIDDAQGDLSNNRIDRSVADHSFIIHGDQGDDILIASDYGDVLIGGLGKWLIEKHYC